MAMDLRVPPLCGTYGRAGCGKSSDKIRAFPNAYFFASPGGLIPAISEVGFTPKFEEMTQVADLDVLRARVDAALKRDKSIREVVIDDLSMIAARTERVLKEKTKDGRQLYGILNTKLGALFDEWRNYGLTVAVDTHVIGTEWKTDDQGIEQPHIPENMVAPGRPNLPGRRSSPEMIKAFDLFYRVVPGPTDIMAPGVWSWRYRAGPWGDGGEWESKDRWNVARGSNGGLLPMNLGEILRFVHRRYTPSSWTMSRPKGMEKDEDLVVWAAAQILADSGKEAEVLAQVARQVVGLKNSPVESVKRTRWIVQDIRARVEIEKLHSPTALLREIGLTGIF